MNAHTRLIRSGGTRIALIILTAVVVIGNARAAAGMTVSVGSEWRPIPASYLGLSVEYNELPRYERFAESFKRLLAVLRPPGDHSPVSLRIGGESADSTFWGPDPSRLVAPSYRQGRPYLIDQAWMTQLAALVQGTGVNVMLDLNAAAHSLKMAAIVARAAAHALPAGSLGQFTIGNEPELYSHGLVGLTQARRGGPNAWAFSFTSNDYDALFTAYAGAIRRAVRGAALAGPEGIGRGPHWVGSLLTSEKRGISMITEHLYPNFHGCALPGEPEYPSAAGYLSDSVAEGLATWESFVQAAMRGSGLPLRLTEVGTSICGGVKGQSDTFATALWAPDMLFNMITRGIAGVNVHVRANGFANTALDYSSSAGIYAEPLYYGMALFTRALGPSARLMRTSVSGSQPGLKVWAVLTRGAVVKVLLINKSPLASVVTLRSADHGNASLERLTGSSITDNATVALAGQRLGPDGRWNGHSHEQPVVHRGAGYRVAVPAYSAAILFVHRPN